LHVSNVVRMIRSKRIVQYRRILPHLVRDLMHTQLCFENFERRDHLEYLVIYWIHRLLLG